MTPHGGEDQVAALVGCRRFAFHLTSAAAYERIITEGCLLPRGAIRPSSITSHADPSLVERRGAIRLPSGRSLHEAVPFYLSPRQPMFGRIVRTGALQRGDIVAIMVPASRIVGSINHLYDSNPAYDRTRHIGTWDDRDALDWRALARWSWLPRLGDERRSPLTWQRQAELLVEDSVAVTATDRVIVDPASAIAGFHCISVPGVFSP